jgi:hypothetical protein
MTDGTGTIDGMEAIAIERAPMITKVQTTTPAHAARMAARRNIVIHHVPITPLRPKITRHRKNTIEVGLRITRRQRRTMPRRATIHRHLQLARRTTIRRKGTIGNDLTMTLRKAMNQQGATTPSQRTNTDHDNIMVRRMARTQIGPLTALRHATDSEAGN